MLKKHRSTVSGHYVEPVGLLVTGLLLLLPKLNYFSFETQKSSLALEHQKSEVYLIAGRRKPTPAPTPTCNPDYPCPTPPSS